jgi:hypothetical protein
MAWEVEKLAEVFGKDKKKVVSPLVAMLNSQQNDDIQNLFDSLFKVIHSLSDKYSTLKTQRTKLDLFAREDRLTCRRTARERTERMFHVIKAPDEALLGWNPRHIAQELCLQRTFFEKLIRKVRKEEISMRKL